ncbi:hypothetical protein BACOV975_04236 [Bacteroides ovatus V975]|nr:hypothetical protein BACOV975_04236 [Bacteroides ovatus V975]
MYADAILSTAKLDYHKFRTTFPAICMELLRK